MNPKAKQEALDAIGEEAEKLLAMNLAQEVEDRVELIISLARHAFDVRTEQEKARK